MAKGSRLNARQEQFAQELAKGTTQRQAYLIAYPNARKWKPETVDSRASDLANDPKVFARLEELRREIERKNGISREAIIDQLKALGFANIPVKNLRALDKIKALEVMVRILGYDKSPPDESTEISKKRHDALMDALRGWQNANQ